MTVRAARLHKPAGGEIMIDGLPNRTPALALHERINDWTFGRVALSDAEMKEASDLVPNGTPIDIVP